MPGPPEKLPVGGLIQEATQKLPHHLIAQETVAAVLTELQAAAVASLWGATDHSRKTCKVQVGTTGLAGGHWRLAGVLIIGS